jgi:hypothetical protein
LQLCDLTSDSRLGGTNSLLVDYGADVLTRRVDSWRWVPRLRGQEFPMGVAGSNDLIRGARGLHAFGQNKGLPPRWLVTVLGRDAFVIPSILP